MSTVASVNYQTKRIYLSAATVNTSLDLLDVYKDVRALRAITPEHQQHLPIIIAGGNIQKTPTTYTQPYVQLLYGAYIIPYDTIQTLVVTREVFSDDGRAGLSCFDRSILASHVDIDIQVSQVEVREVVVSGSTGPSAADIAVAMRANLAVELARIDSSISSRATISGIMGYLE